MGPANVLRRARPSPDAPNLPASSLAPSDLAPANLTPSNLPTSNLDSVRGLACLLVVALHVVGDTANNGLHLAMTSPWHYAMASIEFLRMPLFTALSGYLYAGNRVTRQSLALFWQKKLRRLGVPLISVTIVFWLLRQHTYGDTTSLPHALLFSFGHLWYIQALVIIFAAVSIADSLIRPGAHGLILAGLAIILFAQAGITVTTFFSLDGAIYLAPYFLFGILLRQNGQVLGQPGFGILALGVMVIVLTAQQMGMFGLSNGVTVLQLPAALAGMACVVFLLQRMPQSRPLAWVGGYSYTIYLWHIVASAGTRTMLLKAGVTSLPLLFGACFVAALIAPILLHHAARCVPLVSVAVTGERQRRLQRQSRRTTWVAPASMVAPEMAPGVAPGIV